MQLARENVGTFVSFQANLCLQSVPLSGVRSQRLAADSRETHIPLEESGFGKGLKEVKVAGIYT